MGPPGCGPARLPACLLVGLGCMSVGTAAFVARQEACRQACRIQLYGRIPHHACPPAPLAFLPSCLQVGISCRKGGSYFNKRNKGFFQASTPVLLPASALFRARRLLHRRLHGQQQQQGRGGCLNVSLCRYSVECFSETEAREKPHRDLVVLRVLQSSCVLFNADSVCIHDSIPSSYRRVDDKPGGDLEAVWRERATAAGCCRSM